MALRPWRSDGTSQHRNLELAKAILSAENRHMLFLPMQPPGDAAISEDVARELGDRASIIKCAMDPREALAVIGRLSGLVAMRLHALIFGCMAAVPMAALSYDPKVAQFMERIGQGARSFELEGLDPEAA